MNREDFLSAGKLKTVPVEIPECGTMTMRQLSAKAGKTLNIKAKKARADDQYIDLMVDWIIACAVNDDLTPMFTDSPADRELIGNLSLTSIVHAGTAASKINTVDVEEKEKN